MLAFSGGAEGFPGVSQLHAQAYIRWSCLFARRTVRISYKLSSPVFEKLKTVATARILEVRSDSLLLPLALQLFLGSAQALDSVSVPLKEFLQYDNECTGAVYVTILATVADVPRATARESMLEADALLSSPARSLGNTGVTALAGSFVVYSIGPAAIDATVLCPWLATDTA